MSAVEAKPQRQAAKPLSTRAKKRIVSEQARNARLKKEETTNNDFYTPKDVDAEDVKPKLDANGEVKKKITFDHFDSSDEEDLRNTIGNIPVKWYDDEDHIGYDKDGEKISKPAKKGEIDSFLEKQEDKDYWRKVYDKQLGKDVVLTDEQVDKLNLLASGKYPQIGYNPYQPFLDIYSSEHSIHPIDNSVERKSAFIPSKNEMLQVSRIVHAIKMGWARPPRPAKQTKPPVYDLWSKEDDDTKKTRSELARMRMHYPAPKVDLPTHYESYNPAEEYLMTEEEKKKWEEMDPEDRKIQYMPQKFDALRHVPQYDRFISERFERCLDLYLAPRQRKMKLQVEASDLLPDLPNPNDLKPFPTKLAFYMCGHEGQVRCIASEPEKGELLVSGGEDGTVRVWMINSGRCIKVIKLDEPVTSVAFCPVASRTMVAVSYGNKVALINTECGDKLAISETTKLLAGVQPEIEEDEVPKVKWSKTKKNDRVVLTLPYAVKQVTWHSKGDYFATVAAADVPQSVYIHQLSKCRSQCPFSKRKGYIQTVAFHPAEPTFFVATQRHVRMYDLAKCQLKKKLITGLLSLSTICPDREGENLFVGGLDNRFSWMDLQLSDKPWKQLRHHTSAIRSIAYHKRYPLLATVSDDGTALVYYARIHTDFTRDNELVPVKKLIGHRPVNGLSMLSTVWHPTQPWLITAGADGRIALFSY